MCVAASSSVTAEMWVTVWTSDKMSFATRLESWQETYTAINNTMICIHPHAKLIYIWRDSSSLSVSDTPGTTWGTPSPSSQSLSVSFSRLYVSTMSSQACCGCPIGWESCLTARLSSTKSNLRNNPKTAQLVFKIRQDCSLPSRKSRWQDCCRMLGVFCVGQVPTCWRSQRKHTQQRAV